MDGVYLSRPDSSNLANVYAAMEEWETFTCIRFKEKSYEKNFIYIQNGVGWVTRKQVYTPGQK